MTTIHYSPAEAIAYLTQFVNANSDEPIDPVMIEDVFYQLLDPKLEPLAAEHLTDVDNQLIADHIDDIDYIYGYLAQRLPSFYTLVEETMSEMMTNIMMTSEDEKTDEDDA